VFLLLGNTLAPLQPTGWVLRSETLRVDGLTREYLVAEPVAARTGRLPVVVELHGCCTTPGYELQRSGFTNAAAHQAILVFPAAWVEIWNAGACCGNPAVDDVGFVAAVVKRVLAAEPRADPERVYLVGYSNGGRMAYRIACQAPKLFAAYAIFGAVSSYACQEPTPVRILIAAGTKDPELLRMMLGPFMITRTAQEEFDYWRGVDRCDAATAICASGKVVWLVRYINGDHIWPSDMSSVMWNWFTRH
jgi:polyhydroxybutyrate depolymerase